MQKPDESKVAGVRGFLQMYVVGADGAETTLYRMREGEWGGDGSLLKRENAALWAGAAKSCRSRSMSWH